jgi:hypothetical protein
VANEHTKGLLIIRRFVKLMHKVVLFCSDFPQHTVPQSYSCHSISLRCLQLLYEMYVETGDILQYNLLIYTKHEIMCAQMIARRDHVL